jgi:hypothetical protein
MDKIDYVTATDSMVKLAYNMKPRGKVKTGKTAKETIQMISTLQIGIQKQLIAYECLQAAVLLSKDNKGISDNAVKFLDQKIKELANGKIKMDD